MNAIIPGSSKNKKQANILLKPQKKYHPIAPY